MLLFIIFDLEIAFLFPWAISLGNIGTLGFQAGEETGDWRGDLYALGKVLYEASTGMDRNAFPDLPQSMKGYVPGEAFKKLNRIFFYSIELIYI